MGQREGGGGEGGGRAVEGGQRGVMAASEARESGIREHAQRESSTGDGIGSAAGFGSGRRSSGSGEVSAAPCRGEVLASSGSMNAGRGESSEKRWREAHSKKKLLDYNRSTV